MLNPSPGAAATDDEEPSPAAVGIPAHHHVLAIGGAHHAFAGGHITMQQRDSIINSARAALAKRKNIGQSMTPKARAGHVFGSLMPAVPWREGGESK